MRFFVVLMIAFVSFCSCEEAVRDKRGLLAPAYYTAAAPLAAPLVAAPSYAAYAPYHAYSVHPPYRTLPLTYSAYTAPIAYLR